jgi:hypothetical protein
MMLLIFAASLTPAFAHDPKKHQQQGATAPDCSKLKSMDASKMDPNDPVMNALRVKCQKQTDHDNMDHSMMGQEQMNHGPNSSQVSTKSAAGAAPKPGDSSVDCSKMKGMDMAKMDPKDVAAKAQRDKCMKAMKNPPPAGHKAPAGANH